MKSAGDILKNKRIQLGFTLEQLSLKLKIQEKYLKALEDGDNNAFDSKVIARGFLIKYCKLLGLNEEKIEAFWRRDFNLVGSVSPTSKSFWEKLYITPRILIISIFIIFVFLIASFSLYQYFLLKTPPSLLISEPTEGLNVKSDSVVVKGRVEKTAEVYLNNKKLNISDDGNFSEKVYLINGFNKLSFKALSPFGVEKSKIINLYADYPKNFETNTENQGKLNVFAKGTLPTFVEVKEQNKEIFSGFLMPGVVKVFKGDKLFFYTDTIENIELTYNDKKVEVKEAGIFTKEFIPEIEK